MHSRLSDLGSAELAIFLALHIPTFTLGIFKLVMCRAHHSITNIFRLSM